jgi:hypothetical protein
MMAKQDSAREPSVATDVTDSGGEHDLRAFKIFRESYMTFMDECSRIWHLYCHHIAEGSNSARERLAAAGASPTADNIASIQNELADAQRADVDKLRGELQRAVQSYAKGNASGWTAAGEQKHPEWLMWHVATGQANAAATYSSLLRALGS